ncbi:hypothetical protein [Mesorhizobium silamurunense]|uniref:hypothetical protein n=1 Tax=Mesorhizobium silamurunense TaxID=499528 RepID=UPI001784B0D4|nr:hypothetical protein [Mesorhizobium silamurunense]
MTVILACTFPGGAAIAADTLLHNPDTMRPVMNSSKILTIGTRVAIAQAGSFTGTESVWEKLERLPSESATPKSVADAIMEYAHPMYLQKSATGATTLRYLVAGLEADGTPAIRWLGFDTGDFTGVTGECQVVALGTQPNVQEIAMLSLRGSLKSFSNSVRLDEWCRRVVAAEVAASPQAVGFPAILVVLKQSGGFGKQINPDDVPEPAYEVFWP